VTTVAAFAINGAVHMAADTCTNVYERPIIGGARKIRRVPTGTGEALLGFCGSGGLPDSVAAHHRIEAEPTPGATEDDLQAWAYAIASAITDIARNGGMVDEDGHVDSRVLLGWNGRLWTLTHHMAIPHPDGIAALGSGEGPAIGALDVLAELGMEPAQAVRKAVLVGIHRDRYSEAPVQVETLPARRQTTA
jgi:ATP-dependent protease HslVU (ClpYQ) peptidase subunit